MISRCQKGVALPLMSVSIVTVMVGADHGTGGDGRQAHNLPGKSARSGREQRAIYGFASSGGNGGAFVTSASTRA